MTFPLWLKRSDVDNDTATRISRLTQAHGQDITWNAEIFDGTRQSKRVRRNNTNIRLNINKAALIKVLRIDNCRMHIGEYFKFTCTTHVITIAGYAIRNQLLT